MVYCIRARSGGLANGQYYVAIFGPRMAGSGYRCRIVGKRTYSEHLDHIDLVEASHHSSCCD